MSLQALQALVQEAALAPTDRDRCRRLVRAFHMVLSQDREKALDAAAASLAADDPACRLLWELAQSPELPTRLLSLQIASRLPAAPELTPPWRQLLADRTLPLGMQFAAVVVQVPLNGAGAVELLYAFVRGLDRPAAMERLLSLQARLGKIPAIQEVRLWLGVPLGPRCPRCGVELNEPAMRDHLWKEHRLIIRDELVCDPWVQIEDAVAGAGDDPDRLASCFEQAMSVDGENGLARLERLLAKYGLGKPTAKDSPDESKDGKPTLLSSCPRCGGTMLPPVALPARPVNVAQGKLSLDGFRVEITERGLVSNLEVVTPHETIYRGREPGRFLALRGAILVFAGLPVLIALLLAVSLHEPRAGVAACLVASAAGYGFALSAWKYRDPATDRAFKHAWSFFAVRANSPTVRVADTEFLAGLAAVSGQHGRPTDRARPLERVIAHLEPALRTSLGLLDRLVLLWRLAIEDSARLGRDPTVPTARLIFRCLEGQLPLSAADRLLGPWEIAAETRARLRSRIWEQASESGLTVGPLREAGRLAPALGLLIGEQPLLNDPNRVAEMRKETPEDIAGWKERLQLPDARRCPACGERFLARPGEKGIAVDGGGRKA